MSKTISPLHIAIDMDDVIVDFVGGLRDAVYKEYGVLIGPEQVTQWDLHPLLDPIIGYSWWRWLRDREWIWANFPAIPGAIGSIERLRKEGHYLEIVTSKPEWAEHNVWKWLGKWRPAVQTVTIVGLGESKADATDAYVLIDDKAENIEQFLLSGREGILYKQPQNQGKMTQTVDNLNISRLHVADGWREVLEIIHHGR